MTSKQPQFRLSRTCAAPPETVFDLLSDLRSHLEWGGARQSPDFRLLSMESTSAPASVGTRFRTTGAIPMSARRWHDESVVTLAERPGVFEFVTEAVAGAMSARYRHRYEIKPEAGGCVVSYSMVQERLENPVLRLGLPGIRTMMWRAGIPMFAGRGFRNLLAAAEAKAQAPGRLSAGAGVAR